MVRHSHRSKDEEFVTDLEVGTLDGSPVQQDFTRFCGQLTSVDDDGRVKNVVKVVIDSKVGGEKEAGDLTVKEKRKKASSVKKAPKPPRPPRGFSLDAADQKLIKELAEIAMMKRARIERMKVLKQKRALKASSSSSMNGSLFATLFTVIFFLMILLQGMSCKSPAVTSQVLLRQLKQTRMV